jgi:hypothetical protein
MSDQQSTGVAKFQVGDRVRLGARVRSQFKHPDRLGVVVKIGPKSRLAYVQWDGLKSADHYSFMVLEPVNAE